MDLIKEAVEEIRARLGVFPADVNTFILLTALREILAPAHANLMMASDEKSQQVARQVKLITDVAAAVIDLLNLKKVEVKN